MSDAPLSLSVVIPCYNEEAVVSEVHRRVSKVAQSLAVTYEIIFVEDGSTDRTWETLHQLSHADSHLLALKLSRNHGHQLALSAGLNVARGQHILILDADLQDPPELLPEMLALAAQGADVVYGQRRERQGETLRKRISASLFYRLINLLSDRPIPVNTGDFRLLSRRALDVFNAMPERHRFIRGMISWIGFTQVPLLYDRAPRFAGRTHYPFRKMFKLAVDGVTAVSIRPLQIASGIGLCTGLLAVVLLVYSLIGWLTGNVQAGWTSLMATIAILSSVQLFVLGIIGEYLGRLYEQAQHRPLYIIEQIAHTPAPAAPLNDPAP